MEIGNSETSDAGATDSGPVTMERLFEEYRALNQRVERISVRLQSLEEKTISILSLLKELNEMTKKHYKTSFSIKGSPYEVLIM